MEYKVIFSEEFENDLDHVINYISNKLFSPIAAKNFYAQIKEKINYLNDSPFIYPVYHDEKLSKEGVRYIVISNYLMFYTVNEPNKEVIMLRLTYGKRNITDIIDKT